MADSGTGLINLKRAGGWKSATVAESYIAESAEMKSLQVKALSTPQETKKAKTKESNAAKDTSNKTTTTVEEADKNPAAVPAAFVALPIAPVSVVINNFYRRHNREEGKK